MSKTRPRHDACLIRPERGLSVRQIRHGEYFSRPDVSRYMELVHDARAAAAARKPKPPSMHAGGRGGGGGEGALRPLSPSQSAPTLLPSALTAAPRQGTARHVTLAPISSASAAGACTG